MYSSFVYFCFLFLVSSASLGPYHFCTLLGSSFHEMFPSLQFSSSVMSHSLCPHVVQHDRLPCPSPTPGTCWNSCALSQWCYPTIWSSIIPFSSWFQFFPASGSFLISQFFAPSGESTEVSASAIVLAIDTQDWFPLGLTDFIFLLSKGLSRIFSNTTVQKHQFFSAQLSLYSNSHILTWPMEKP